MLFLKARNGKVLYLLNTNEYTVGRKDCSLTITNDQSISRLHAKILVKNKKVVLIDAGSRYGTFVNKEKAATNTEVELKAGFELRFGQLQSFYSVEETTIITTTSSIKGEQKKNLTNNIALLDGLLISNWKVQCTHVTVEEIQLTVKVLCAIIKGVPIVTLKYWDDYVTNAKNNLPPPDVTQYKPICSEVTLKKNIALDFKPERLTLFKDKVFVFPTKNDKAKMIDMIKLAGGDAISWDTNPFTTEELTNPKIEYIILEMGDSTTKNIQPTLLKIIKHNTSLGRRTIPLQEIALALINCSCEKDCNSSFDRKGTVLALKTQRPYTQHTENILALSTQTQGTISVDDYTNQIIQGTIDIEMISNKVPDINKKENIAITEDITEVKQTSNGKRENEQSDEPLFNSSKKLKLDPSSLTNTTRKQLEPVVSAMDSPRKGVFRRDVNTNNEQAKEEYINPFAMKRKTRETDDVDNPSKRITVTESNNLSSSSSSSVVNPFSFLRSKKSSASTSKDNDIPSTSKSIFNSSSKSDKNMASSTCINNDAMNTLQLDISAIVPVDSTVINNFGWMSKIKNESTCMNKSQKTNLDVSSQEVDADLIKYIESFKNTLVIKEEPMMERRNSTVSNSSNISSFYKGNNFKTFKKIQPKKIQTTIVPESSYVPFVCNQNCAIQAIQEDSDKEDDVATRIPLQRRFVF